MKSEEKKFPGGLLVGETDKNGEKGIKVIAPEGNILMGGGEAVIVSDALKAKEKYEFEGDKKTPCEILSDINHKYKGVKIPCDIAEPANTTDSRMEVGDVIARNKSMKLGGLFHGSHKKFTKFSLSNVGEGGKSVGGWGIYVSTSKDVARQYLLKSGALYEVTVYENGEWLDFDETLDSGVAQSILRGLKRKNISTDEFRRDFLAEGEDGYEVANGKQVYDYLSSVLGSEKKASLFLLANGIIGNRFKDKTEPDATNYVVFDAAAIKIDSDDAGSDNESMAKGGNISSESIEDQIARFNSDYIRVSSSEGESQLARILKKKIEALKRKQRNTKNMATGGGLPNINEKNEYKVYIVDGDRERGSYTAYGKNYIDASNYFASHWNNVRQSNEYGTRWTELGQKKEGMPKKHQYLKDEKGNTILLVDFGQGSSMASGGRVAKYHWKKRPDGSFGIYNENGLQVKALFSKEAALEYLEKANDTKNYEIWGQWPVKKSKYERGDMVYSFQNKDYPAPIAIKRFSPWADVREPHENDTWQYVVTLKNGQRSKNMSEGSLFTARQMEYAHGGEVLGSSRIENFTPVEVINDGWRKMKEKMGERKAKKYFEQADRLMNPNQNEIVEYRTNGIVTREGGKYMFYPIGGTDYKNWWLLSKMDVSDQFPTMAHGGGIDVQKIVDSNNARIDEMVKDWNSEGRAFSKIQNEDSLFMERIGVPYDKIGITSQTGNDILYYDTNIYSSDSDALKRRRKMTIGGQIPDRYREMGFTHVGQQKKSTRPEKKWMVLAKKGDQYKVVHGGQKGMKDFSQHHSEARRQRFWNRMGGENSKQANDPFSPLYWHKKYGTWEDGGLLESGGEIEGDGHNYTVVYEKIYSDGNLSDVAYAKTVFAKNEDEAIREFKRLYPKTRNILSVGRKY